MDTEKIRDISISLTSYKEFYDYIASLRKNYKKKAIKGIYNKELAVKGYLNLIRSFVKLPIFMRLYCSSKELNISAQEYREIAVYIENYYSDEIFYNIQGE